MTVDIPVDAYIPDDYINDRALKMNFYQRLANLELPEQAEAMTSELADRFGTPPEPVAQLLELVRLKTEAGILGFVSVSARDNEVVLKVKRTVAPDRVALYKRFRNSATVHLGEIRIPRRQFSPDTGQWLAELRELLSVIAGRDRSAAKATAG